MKRVNRNRRGKERKRGRKQTIILKHTTQLKLQRSNILKDKKEAELEQEIERNRDKSWWITLKAKRLRPQQCAVNISTSVPNRRAPHPKSHHFFTQSNFFCSHLLQYLSVGLQISLLMWINLFTVFFRFHILSFFNSPFLSYPFHLNLSNWMNEAEKRDDWELLRPTSLHSFHKQQ